jgi:uncharacterized protein
MTRDERVSMATKYLLVASTEACSGKSAAILGIADRLQAKGIKIAYIQPVVTDNESDFRSQLRKPNGMQSNVNELTLKEPQTIVGDCQLMAKALSLPASQTGSSLLVLDEAKTIDRLTGVDHQDYAKLLQANVPLSGDLVILEGCANLSEGSLFGLATTQVAADLNADVLLVNRYHPISSIDIILSAQQQLGKRLIGVIINDVPRDRIASVQATLVPYLERAGIPTFGIIHRNPDRLDLMVESLSIGAMNVNSALEYFRRGHNMAVVTGGDRADIQLAALETSTQCLILTGHLAPQPFIVSRAEDLEIPILSVDLDTLTTVEIIDRAFGRVRLQEPIKIDCARELFGEQCEIDRLMSVLGLG